VASLLEVGTGFHPELTGRENIFLNGAILGMTRTEIKRKFDEIVAFAEIEKFLDTPVKRYSSGMYVRLAFAVAAHLEPEILIVDEVLAVGDAQFQKKCLGKMEEVGREGRTVLFVSHNMAAVQKICNKGALVDKGSLLSMAPVADIVSQYSSLFGDCSNAWELQKDSVKDVYIEKVRVAGSDPEPHQAIVTGDSLRIFSEIVIRRIHNNLQLGVCLLDEFGNQIFGSAPQDDGLAPPSDPGRYAIQVVFPQGVLLPKQYGIKVILWTPQEGILDSVEAVKFIPLETASLSNMAPGGRAGVLAVRCQWSINP
ncbi:MAG: ABC transporter ATP-binding protein, partial [Desulfuromonadales bacterium]|nr:ABC transporter ATP-binding protein [Desulfuromonadales bacterium]